MKRVLGMGEIMIQMNPAERGSLRFQQIFERHIAGSEGNVIIQMQRLGIPCGFITAVGQDEFGQVIISALRSEGVDTDPVKIDPAHPTAVYFVQRSYPIPGKTTVRYYRKGSAASFFGEDDLDDSWFEGIGLFHVSGITPALSIDSKKAALAAVRMARNAGAQISFDTNIRVNLLKDTRTAHECLDEFIDLADILFSGSGDLAHLFPDGDPEQRLLEMANNSHIVVIKRGGEGATAFQDGREHACEALEVEVIDELGAGDAFDGAFLASILLEKDVESALRYANAAGAITVGLKGDIEPLPTWSELETFLKWHGREDSGLLR